LQGWDVHTREQHSHYRPGLRAVQVERPQRGEDDLDGGENAGGQLDLPAGGREVGAVAITER